MLKGAGLDDVGVEVFWLSVFVPAYAGLALMRFRSTLD
jgi:ABC-2 type transport system permease protein